MRALSLSLALLALPVAVRAADFNVERVATGLSSPVYATAPASDPLRLFIVEQDGGSQGRVRVLYLPTLTLRATEFLEVSPVSSGFEQGLLGLAFHPDYDSNGLFFVSYTDSGGDLIVERYSVSGDPEIADANSASRVIEISEPASNHNGGWIGFGPDDMLYISSGDGGGGHDSGGGHTAGTGNAQDITSNLLGKILRIDVDGDDFPGDPDVNYAIPTDNPFVGITGDDEIWAYGVRNPWRCSFDRATGHFYIGDVGQATWEEVNVQLSTSPGGENYGWRLREGAHQTPTGGVGGPAPGAIDPFFEYAHSGNASVTGGYVYRGPAVSLFGRYFVGDFETSDLYSMRWDGSAPTTHDGTNFVDFVDHTGTADFEPDIGSLTSISSFGEDALGNLYIVSLGGDVFRITADAVVPAISPGGGLILAAALALAGLFWLRRRAPLA